MDGQSDRNLDSGLYSMQHYSDRPIEENQDETSPKVQLGRTMRGVFRDRERVQTDQPIEENLDQTFPKQVFPGLPNIEDDALRRPTTRNKGFCCRPRCVAIVLVVLTVVAGLVAAIYFSIIKDDNSSNAGAVIFLDDPPKNPCEDVIEEMGKQAMFKCDFGKKNVTNVIISTTMQPVRISYNKINSNGSSRWTFPGPMVNCSTAGRYSVQFEVVEKLHDQSKTYYDSTTVNVKGVIIASMTQDGTNINISCNISGDCMNHHINIYARTNISTDIRVLATESCSGKHTIQHGYVKNCSSTAIDSTGNTHIGCRVQPRNKSFPEVEFKLSDCDEENVTRVNRTCPCIGRDAGICTSEYIWSQSAVNNITQYTVCPSTCINENSTLSWCPFSSAIESQESGNNQCPNENNSNDSS